MRDVAEQSLLRPDHRLESLRHRVEITAELSNFILPLRKLRRYTRAEISPGELVCRCAKFQDGLREIAGQPVTKDAANHQDHEQSQAESLKGRLKRRTRNVCDVDVALPVCADDGPRDECVFNSEVEFDITTLYRL